MRKPQLNPSAEAFVPCFGSDSASWAQKLQTPAQGMPNGAAANGGEGPKTNGNSKSNSKAGNPPPTGTSAKGGPAHGNAASHLQHQTATDARRNDGFVSANSRLPSARGGPREGSCPRSAANGDPGWPHQQHTDSSRRKVDSSVNGSAEPRGAGANRLLRDALRKAPQGQAPSKAFSARPPCSRQVSGTAAANLQPVAVGSTNLSARLAAEQESWSASATRRAIGSDSGDLEFDDLFGGGGGDGDSRGTTPPSFGGSGGGALEHSLSNQALPSGNPAELASAISLEAALATGGMYATSYVQQPSPVGATSLDDAVPDAVSDAAVLPPVPASLSLSVSVPAADLSCHAMPFQADLAPGTPQAQMKTSDVPMSPSKVSPADFQVLKVVGQGAFGKVFLVRKRDTGHVYAMKVMRKDKILARDHGEYVRAERDVLTSVRHPYIVMLHWSFQTSTKLYLVLDFVNGGHLFFNLYRAGIFEEAQACLYTAEIVAAIAHLHSLHILHRDLKPENVLLDGEGHVRITDFGLAKSVPEGSRSNSLIGTMEYMAPEIINGSGHNKSVDWWSIGVLLYEMVCGITPFRSKEKNALKRMITQQKLKFTKSADGYLSQPCKSLMRALLEKDPTKRLGGGTEGSAAVKKHPFFRSINWAALEQRQVPSPYCPRTSGIDCVENFDKLWTDRTPEDSPVGSPATPPFGNSFRGFTYVAPSFLSSPLKGSPAS